MSAGEGFGPPLFFEAGSSLHAHPPEAEAIIVRSRDRRGRDTMTRVFPTLLCGLIAALLPARAVAQAGSEAEELFAKGVQLHQSGDILGAIEAYQDALARAPGRIDARSNLGAAFVHLGRYQDAVEQYGKALAIDPDNTRVRFNLALA